MTPMQQFFLDQINKSSAELSPTYLAQKYYESIGKRRKVASRDSFGQTSAAYRTCRTLDELGYINEKVYTTRGGYTYVMFSRNNPCKVQDIKN